MRTGMTSAVCGGRIILAVGLWLLAIPAEAPAQFFDTGPSIRPPADVPGAPPGPSQSIAPPSGAITPPAPKGPQLQSLPPATSPGPTQSQSPAVPAGQVTL